MHSSYGTALTFYEPDGHYDKGQDCSHHLENQVGHYDGNQSKSKYISECGEDYKQHNWHTDHPHQCCQAKLIVVSPVDAETLLINRVQAYVSYFVKCQLGQTSGQSNEKHEADGFDRHHIEENITLCLSQERRDMVLSHYKRNPHTCNESSSEEQHKNVDV